MTPFYSLVCLTRRFNRKEGSLIPLTGLMCGWGKEITNSLKGPVKLIEFWTLTSSCYDSSENVDFSFDVSSCLFSNMTYIHNTAILVHLLVICCKDDLSTPGSKTYRVVCVSSSQYGELRRIQSINQVTQRLRSSTMNNVRDLYSKQIWSQFFCWMSRVNVDCIFSINYR